MATYIVNYNPARWTWGVPDKALAVLRTAGGQLVAERWSTGGRSSEVVPGDRAVLFRQGRGRRGLIGRGVFTSMIYRDFHWDGSGRDANYADIVWDLLLDDEDGIPLEEVAAVAPSVPWNYLQGSGVRVPAPDDDALEGLWPTPSRTSSYSRVPGSDKGWQHDALKYKQVREFARALLMERYRRNGWTVGDSHDGRPFGAVATRRGNTLHLAARGSETDDVRVLGTAEEVVWATGHPGERILALVSALAFDEAGCLDGTTAVISEYQWDASTGALEPRACAARHRGGAPDALESYTS